MMKKALFGVAAVCAALIFAGCPEDEPEPDQPFELTVTGLESAGSGKMWGATLLDEDDPNDTPLAIGILYGNGPFKFFFPRSTSEGGLPYDTNRPFAKSGQYVVALAKTTLQDPFNPEAIYFYKESGSKKPVAFPVSAPLLWSAFVLKED